jgi:hypothetical protein
MVNYGIRVALGLAGIGLAAALPFLAGSGRPEAGQNRPGPSAPPQPPPIDGAAARARAWQRAETLLAGAEREAAAALDKHLASVHDFLARRKPGSRAFAGAVLGLRGKWELVKNQVSGGDGEYAAFLQGAFSEHLFRGEDLEQAVAAAARAYLSELDGIEASLLVRLRADLADGVQPPAGLPAGSDEVFRSRYRELAGRVEQDLRTDLAYVAGREALSWTLLPELVNAVTRRIVTALAVRAGFSSAGLAASTTFSAVTFGASLVAFFVLDYVIDRIVKAAGYDAEEKVAGRVAQALDDLGRILTDGDPEARATLAKLQAMQQTDPDPEVRAACVEAVQSIEAGARLFGLRGELTKIAAARASVRKEALRRLIHESEVTR